MPARPRILTAVTGAALVAATFVVAVGHAEGADFAPRPIQERRLPCEAGLPIPVLEGSHPAVAGERRWIRWPTPGPEVEELELLLSLDDGSRFVLRVSPELPGAEDRYEWTVPNLATSHARLRLRMRIRGVETESEIGASFAIVADLARPLDRDLWHEGGWWSGLSPAGGAGPSLAPRERGPRLEAGRDTDVCEAPVRAPVASALPNPVHPCDGRTTAEVAGTLGAASFHPPRRTPLRT